MITTPTDSLYKFLAIGGLLGIGFSIYLYVVLVERSNTRVAEYREAAAGAAAMSEHLETLQQKLALLEQSRATGGPPEAFDQWLAVQNRIVETKREIERADTLKELVNTARNDMESGGRVVSYTFLSSSLICIVGFVLWYRKIQRYQDVRMKAQRSE